MPHELNDSQLVALLAQGPQLDQVMPALPDAMQQQFLDLVVRAGNAYNAGVWKTQSGGMIVAPEAPAPTVEEAQQLFGSAYLALEGHPQERQKLRTAMDAIGLTPAAKTLNPPRDVFDVIATQVVSTVQGWFR